MDNKSQIRQSLTARHHATLFAYIVKSSIDIFGNDCIQTLENGIRRYGNQRGYRMAQRALKDRNKLDILSYLIYGEWESAPNEMQIDFYISSSDVNMTASKCSWYDEWNKENLLRYGVLYCDFVDAALLEGFNPELKLDLLEHRTKGAKNCDFYFRDGNLNIEEINEASRTNKLLGKTTKKHWDYHIGHIYKTLKQELEKDFRDEGLRALRNALEMYREKYGQEVYEILLEFEDTNFDIVDDYESIII
ncbi:MAG: L-2-amino-thiazoline-4-carboxylic acid hydrolase [Tissierellaceae bacterium]|nr:L-2-amino-thiazoline-4-carboxylic acid hydrolase [Tissierellaceae bacterium]